MNREILLPDCGVVFYEDVHQYWKDGKQLYGITGLISRHLFPDKYSSVNESVLKTAAWRGSVAHRASEEYDMFGAYTLSDDEKADKHIPTFTDNYVKLKEQNGFTVVASEYIVTDNTHYASAIDRVIIVDDSLCISDIKTTYLLDKEYVSWQLSIYRYLFEKQTGIKVDKLFALWLRNGGKMVEVEYKGDDKVEALLDADRCGEIYDPMDLSVEPSKDAEKALVALKDILVEIERLDGLKKSYIESIEEMFNELGIDSWDTEYFKITKVADTVSNRFDSVKFKDEHPHLYEQYIVESKRKGYIKTTPRWK